MDDRLSLWDLQIRNIKIQGKNYEIQDVPERGSSCLVYRAKKMVQIGQEKYEQNILLKEFYPLLNPEEDAGIDRKEDGSFVVPNVTKSSWEYQRYLEKFHNSAVIMLEMGNAGVGSDHGAVPLSVMEDHGTWYIEEVDDSGHIFQDVFVKEKRLLYTEDMDPIVQDLMKNLGEERGLGQEYEGMRYHFRTFLEIYKNLIWSLKRLHDIGYYHLDLNPRNISLTSGGNVKLFDTDTFLKEDQLQTIPVERYTQGYAAPELLHVICHGGKAETLIGPWTDIYSATQILCWYLYGYPLDAMDLEDELELLEEKIQQSFDVFGCRIGSQGVDLLKDYIRANLSIDYERRMASAMEAYRELGTIQWQLFEEVDAEKQDEPLCQREEWEDVKALIEEDPLYVKWNWVPALFRMVLGMGMISAGGVLLSKAAFLMTQWADVANVGLILHVIGNGTMVTGVLLAMYCFYEYWSPRGWRQFLRESFYPVIATIMTVFAYTMPPFFFYHTGFDPSWWETLDFLQAMVEHVMVGCEGILLCSWVYVMKHSGRKGRGWLITLSVVLFVLSMIHLYALI